MPVLTFLNSLFLIGLAAAVLPILIHLFSRRRAKDVPFPSLEYLREITHQRIRRMRLRQWLLLALRVLILTLFALAMGRPALRGSSSPVTRGSSTVAIILDNSYSLTAAAPEWSGDLPVSDPSSQTPMGTSGEDGLLFERARQRALEVCDLMSDEDRGFLALSGRPVSLPFQTPVANIGLLRREIEQAQVTADRSDLPAALEQVLPILEASRTINKELFVVSDFQRRDLEEWIRQGRDAGPLASALLVSEARADTGSAGTGGSGTGSGSIGGVRIPEGVRVYLVPLNDESIDNATIERVRFDPAGARPGGGKVIASILNHGEDRVSDRVARILSGGAAVGSPVQNGADAGGSRDLADALFSVPAHGRVDVEFNLPSLPPGGELEIQLGSDLLEWDNRAFLVTTDSGVQKILLIGGESGGGSGAGIPSGAEDAGGERSGSGRGAEGVGASDAFPGVSRGLVGGDELLYLRKALDPTGNGEFFSLRTAGPEALVDPAGWSEDVVILSNVGRLSEAAVENLTRFRAKGGGILIALGDRVDPRYYNTQILSKLSSIELLNVRQDEGEGTYRSLRPVVVAHPIFAGFPIGPGDDLSSARFRKTVDARVGKGARVIAEWSGQLPAIIEEDGVLVITSSLDGVWSDFVTSASFLPWIHQATHYLASRSGGDKSARYVGAQLEVMVEEGSFTTPVACVDPGNGRASVDAVAVDQRIRLRSTPTTSPGIHRFEDASGKTIASFAVNLDPKEGDLARAEVSALERFFGRTAQRLQTGQAISRDLLEGRYGRELWRPILALVLILLAVESLLGRGRLLT